MSAPLVTKLLSGGPGLAGFGRYLASRPDALAPALCAALERIPDAAPSETLPPSEVPAGVGWVDPEPFASRLDHQLHRAHLEDERPVTLKRVREAAATTDLEALLTGEGVSRSLARALATDHLEQVRRRRDLTRELAALTRLADENGAPGLVVARPLPEHSGKTRLVRSSAHGWRLDEWREHLARLPSGFSARRELARHLASLWLRRALGGLTTSVDFEGEGLLVSRDAEVVIAGGPFLQLEPELGRRLRDYLSATVADDPDAAASALGRCLEAGDPRRALRDRLRQANPGADGLWSGTPPAAAHVVEHWRAAHALGFPPRGDLLLFLRSFWSLARRLEQLAPGEDPLRDAIEDLDLARVAEEARRFASALTDPDSSLRFAERLLDLPARLDAALEPAPAESAASRRTDSDRSGWRTAGALVLVVPALALLTRTLGAAAPEASAAIEVLGGLAISGAGAFGLQRLSRGGPTAR